LNLLIFNLKYDLNDSALATSALIIEALSKNFDNVFLISTHIGKIKSIPNIKYFSLTKSKKNGRLVKILRFYYFLFKILRDSNQKLFVFSHMAPIYVLMAGPILCFLNIPITLWYAHKNITLILKLSTYFTSNIVSAEKLSFRLRVKSPIKLIGHGIYFPKIFPQGSKRNFNNICIHGRISEVKNIHTIIESLYILKSQFRQNLNLNIYGECLTKKDFLYKKRLLQLISLYKLQKYVFFRGAVNIKKIQFELQKNILALNCTTDWSLDKSGLEALAAGIPLIYSNPSYNEIFRKSKIDFSYYFVEELTSMNLAEKICNILSRKDLYNLPFFLSENVRKEHGITAFVSRLFPIILNSSNRG
jgi:glycosyltransferase involved in cell wall biosynthesis